MTNTRTITLGDRTFDVPALPLRINMVAYPLCQKLSNGELPIRVQAAFIAGSAVDLSEEEMNDLAKLAYHGARAADPTLTEDTFYAILASPQQLIDAFFLIRYQTGAWVQVDPAAAGDSEPGEAPGADEPPK